MIPIIIGVIILVGTSLLVNTKLLKKESNKIVQITSTAPEVTLTQAPKSSTKPTQDPKKVEDTTNLKYPNSTVVSQNGSTTIYESSDNADAITDWYKKEIEDLNMNVKSFVTTKTNGKILNKLVGSDGKVEIDVEITKPSEEDTVKISVKFD